MYTTQNVFAKLNVDVNVLYCYTFIESLNKMNKNFPSQENMLV